MAVTIDHLRVEHRVTVLQAFTDLHGTHVPAGDSGTLRGLGLDHARMEIWIDLERVASRDTLRFALRATDGPRNGHMREFFEMGEPVDSTPVPATPPTPAGRAERAATETREIASTVVDYQGKQPPHDTSLDQRRVACVCDSSFHRPLLAPIHEYSVHACLRCGTVTCTRTIGDDGRFTGNAWYVNKTVELGHRAVQWLADVPRIKEDHTATSALWPMAAEFVRYATLYYPADARCETLDDLAALESTLSRQQSGQSVAECIRATCRIRMAPPAELSNVLRGYEYLWDAMQLRPDSDVSLVLSLAQPGLLGSALATDLLLRRADAFDVMRRALQSDDGATRRAGFSMARDMNPVDPRLADVLIDMLSTLTLEPSLTVPGQVVGHARFAMIFLIVAETRVSSPTLLVTLRALLRPLARHDATLVDYLRIAIREMAAS